MMSLMNAVWKFYQCKGICSVKVYIILGDVFYVIMTYTVSKIIGFNGVINLGGNSLWQYNIVCVCVCVCVCVRVRT